MNISQIASSAYENIASLKRINSAADDAAGLSIAQELTAQSNGLQQSKNNIENTKDLLNTSDGALEGIQDSLQRIRELGVQASNGILSDSDKGILQQEIDELKEGISSLAKNTEFNTIKLLDGSFADKNVALNPTGNGMTISIANSSLEALGIKDFDVTKDFSLDTIDDAIKKVSESRSNIGAKTNSLTHSANYTAVAFENEQSALSTLEDADIAEEYTNLKRDQILQQYKIQMQKIDMTNQSQMINFFL